MTTFYQLHLLTSYPPANLNRDDSGQPKSAMMGGALRARVSSQSLKRAWRTSEPFEAALKGHVGKRTKRFAEVVKEKMLAAGKDEKKALEAAAKVAAAFATIDKDKPIYTGQLVHLSPAEMAAVDGIAERLAKGEEIDIATETLLGGAEGAADIAMFGRMLADKPDHSVEAAVQVAHAITTHRVTIEDDYFTAVDDLKTKGEDAGAGHVGEQEFVAGLFYMYLCVDFDLLKENLGGDEALARTAIKALADAALKVGPKGKQASFASRAYAMYALAEKGSQQPRSLSTAFLKPVSGTDMLTDSIASLEKTLGQMDKAYGSCSDARYKMNVAADEGTLEGLQSFLGQ
ncbi:MAG: type I-E CRISPR-associated protein Cas7/Cse4/CasC [Alphaproteobacteria bacterium]|nr:type I-E CRISPR-associated protein Cas7/Cse4/CasC [Alphaproteobacteria bacterium]